MEEISAYASAIGVNVSSTSSIPDSLSGVFIPLEPEFEDQIFKGLEHSVVNVKIIPSVIYKQVFTSDSNQWESGTGFHLTSENDNELGSVVTQET